MEIYVDVVVVENTIINFFLLLLTAKLLRFQYRKIGIYFSALLGGIYTLAIFSDIEILNSLFIKVVMAFLMIVISIQIKKIINVIKAVMVFYINSFILSGVCLLIALSQNSNVIGQSVEIQSYSIKWLILAVMIIYIVLTRITDYLSDRAIVKNLSYDIYINAGEETLLLKGFLDTGNELREPVTNLPCILVQSRYLEKIYIPESEKYYINYQTINETGRVFGFKGKDIRIRSYGSQEWKSINAIICGCNNKLSIEDDMQVLLSRGVI